MGSLRTEGADSVAAQSSGERDPKDGSMLTAPPGRERKIRDEKDEGEDRRGGMGALGQQSGQGQAVSSQGHSATA